MSKKNFPHAITVLLVVVATFSMCFGRADLAVYNLLMGICLQDYSWEFNSCVLLCRKCYGLNDQSSIVMSFNSLLTPL